MAVINPQEKKLAKRTSVQWSDLSYSVCYLSAQAVKYFRIFIVFQSVCNNVPTPHNTVSEGHKEEGGGEVMSIGG